VTLHSLAQRAGKPVVVIVMDEVAGPSVHVRCMETGKQYTVTIPEGARAQPAAWVGRHEVLEVVTGEQAA
jgi:hypothetical protein